MAIRLIIKPYMCKGSDDKKRYRYYLVKDLSTNKKYRYRPYSGPYISLGAFLKAVLNDKSIYPTF